MPKRKKRCQHLRLEWHKFRWFCHDCRAEVPMVNAADLARLLTREWRPAFNPAAWSTAEAKAYDRGAREVIGKIASLLRDAEARSTISVKG